MDQETRAFGFCLSCTRVRWLDRVTGVDRLNNQEGVCPSCAREEVKTAQIKTLPIQWVHQCEFCIMDPSHYREDGTCRCNDPDHYEMEDWGYSWHGYGEYWYVPDDDEEEDYEDDNED